MLFSIKKEFYRSCKSWIKLIPLKAVRTYFTLLYLQKCGNMTESGGRGLRKGDGLISLWQITPAKACLILLFASLSRSISTPHAALVACFVLNITCQNTSIRYMKRESWVARLAHAWRGFGLLLNTHTQKRTHKHPNPRPQSPLLHEI